MGEARKKRWVFGLLLLGCYLTLRGYHSFDGDQAYRLPLLFHRQSAQLYANDPFVRAFDSFNPHEGYLGLLAGSANLIGLPASLFGWFAFSFLLTWLAFDRLSRLVWPELSRSVGGVAISLVLLTKAGNIGTNHLFEATLLDRLLALSLGWTAIADFVSDPRTSLRTSPWLLGLATWVHPSMGLQLTMLLVAGWGLFGLGLCGEGDSTLESSSMEDLRPVGIASGRTGLALMLQAWILHGVALSPALILMLSQSPRLFEGLSREEFRLLSLSIQNPQHMVPHLWRTPQWLAWGCFPILAVIETVQAGQPGSGARRRWLALGALNLAGLALAWWAVEVREDLRVTVFQPFRMATVARGLCLVAIAARVARLWREGTTDHRFRAALLVGGLADDWALVIATVVEIGMTGMLAWFGRRPAAWIGGGLFLLGFRFLWLHDPHQSQWILLAALAGAAVLAVLVSRPAFPWDRARWIRMGLAAWVVPLLALMGPVLPIEHVSWGRALIEGLSAHCRFAETPVDAIERLGAWSRRNIPLGARFITPPGPKSFRLWSRRAVAFNRAGSPYHASGLADWARRFREHVGFRGTTAEFARAYLADRQALERRYDALTAQELVRLAHRQGASFVVAGTGHEEPGLLTRLKTDGRYAVYRVEPPTPELATRHRGRSESAGWPGSGPRRSQHD